MIRLVLIVLVICSTLSACSSQEKADYKEAQKAIDQGHFHVALNSLDRVIKRNSGSDMTLEAAREAARISYYEIKDYTKAVNYYKFLVLHSPDPQERMQSQKQVADIYFDNLQNYKEAIEEFSKLIQMPHNDAEEAEYRLSTARAYYYMGNYFQALSEIEAILSKKSDENIRFGSLVLKGNILAAQKQFVKAAEVFRSIISTYPDRANKESIGLTLAACYEENNDFKNAIAVLETYRGKYNPPEYIELRIKRLQERMRNAPGAKGFRK
jgi:tetratricopeptide (TPR) repeat protein